jgi:MFS family permease
MQVQTGTNLPGNLTHFEKPSYPLGIAIIAALAGFIFGFDTVVISGANQPIKDIWHTTEISPWFHGFFIMSMALWGTVVGAIFGGIPTDKYGRKKVLFWIGVLFTVSAIGSALASDPYSFSVFRFLGGLGIGVSSVAAPAYVSEISTPATRGRLVAMYQFNIVFGILIAFLSNYFLKGFGGANDWRWMLGVMTVPALLYTLLVISIPESPRWLIARKNDLAKAKKVFERIGVSNTDEMVQSIKASVLQEASIGNTSAFFSAKYKRVLWLAFLINGRASILFYTMHLKYWKEQGLLQLTH